MSDQLDPCPFCGGEARGPIQEIDGDHGSGLGLWYECQTCLARAGAVFPSYPETRAEQESMHEAARAAWNRRANCGTHGS